MPPLQLRLLTRRTVPRNGLPILPPKTIMFSLVSLKAPPTTSASPTFAVPIPHSLWNLMPPPLCAENFLAAPLSLICRRVRTMVILIRKPSIRPPRLNHSVTSAVCRSTSTVLLPPVRWMSISPIWTTRHLPTVSSISANSHRLPPTTHGVSLPAIGAK